MRSLFEGCGVAIVTPFKDGQVDYGALEELIKRDVMLGAQAIIVLGTTGEGVTVTDKERERIIKLSKSAIEGNAKLIVGTGNNNFEKCLKNTFMAKRYGADGALVVTPYYNKTTQRGLIEYYKRLGEVGLPMIVYNVPSRTGLNVEEKTVDALCDNTMVYGLKESTAEINRIIRLSSICDKKIALYSGEDKLNYLFYCLGGQGAISVTANIYPERVQAVYEAVKENDLERALYIQRKLDKLNDALFIETNPIPVKYAMEKMGFIKGEVRMPLVSLGKENENILNDAIEDC